MIVDIILIVLIGFSAYTGYKKGLVGILLSIVALILGIFLGLVLKEPVADYLYKNTNIGTNIEESISSAINEKIMHETESVKLFESFIPNQEIQNSYAVSELPKVIAIFVIKIVSFVLIFILVYVICSILQIILNMFFKLPVISSINKFGGAGINVLQMLVKIWLVLAIIYFIIPIQKTSKLSDFINNSLITKSLYENNYLITLLESNIKL